VFFDYKHAVESSLKNETTKFQALHHENFYKEKATSLEAFQGTLCNDILILIICLRVEFLKD
jgi:hypothetical protein